MPKVRSDCDSDPLQPLELSFAGMMLSENACKLRRIML
jgi:hypothetical protein